MAETKSVTTTTNILHQDGTDSSTRKPITDGAGPSIESKERHTQHDERECYKPGWSPHFSRVMDLKGSFPYGASVEPRWLISRGLYPQGYKL